MPDPRIHEQLNTKIHNLHGNVLFKPRVRVVPTNEAATGPQPTNATEQRVMGQAALREVLSRADAKNWPGPRVRAVGAGWSLSTCARSNGWMVETADLAFVKTSLSATSMHAASTLSPAALAWVQCGTRVAAVNRLIEAQGRALKTSGASNGQTIVGAFSTGTHGSAFNVGSMQDAVRGMHLMVDGTRHYWLEAASNPTLSDAAAANAFGADVQVIRDDGVFHAALVSFGSFGLIESVILETDPLYLLSMVRQAQDWNASLKATLDSFDLSAWQQPGRALFGLGLLFAPYDKTGAGGVPKPLVTRTYRSVPPAGFVPTYPTGPAAMIVSDPAAVSWLSLLGNVLPSVAANMAADVVRQRFLETSDLGTAPGTPGAVFTDVVMDSLGASTEIGLPANQSAQAIDIVLDVLRDRKKKHRPFLGPLAVRYVRQSSATLAFTRWPVTACLELPGARVAKVEKTYQAVWDALRSAGIPITLHWGQEHDLDNTKVRGAYGDSAADAWIAAREQLLPTKKLRRRFANRMSKASGLTD